MATSVEHVFASVLHTHFTAVILLPLRETAELIENVCDWPHYVIKFTQSECSFWHSPGLLTVLLRLHSLQYHAGNHHFGLWVSQPIVRLTTRESLFLHSRTVCSRRGEYWAEEAGCNFWVVTLRRNLHFTQSHGMQWGSLMLLRRVFLYPVIALSAVVSHVYALPLRMPCRWCLHVSGQYMRGGRRFGRLSVWMKEQAREVINKIDSRHLTGPWLECLKGCSVFVRS